MRLAVMKTRSDLGVPQGASFCIMGTGFYRHGTHRALQARKVLAQLFQ